MRRLFAVLSCLAVAAAGCVALLFGPAGVAASAPASAAGTFHPVDSVRVLDTRSGAGLAGGHVARFAVTGYGGIPAGAAAVTINLTVLRPATAGSIAVFPGDTAWNGTASVSFAAVLNKQSMVTAKLGADGTLSVRNNIASAIQVIGDVAGYYTGGTPNTPGAFGAIPFQRAFDSRQSHPLASGSVTTVQIAGLGAVPATGVAAVLANLTVITPARPGSLSTWASDAAWDGSASLSFAAGRSEQDVLNVALGSDGSAMIRNNSGAGVQVVLDLIGYYLAGTPAGYGAYQPIKPARVFDSRTYPATGRITPGLPVRVKPVLDQPNSAIRLPEWGVPAVVVRFTVLSPARAGSLSVYREDRAWNGATSISFDAGASVQQQLTTSVGLDEMFEIRYSGAGSVSVVADVLGYYFGVPSSLHYTGGQEIDPAHGRLVDISCPTATFCMAVQRSGFAESWHGAGWSTPVRAGQATTLASVSCTSASFCVAIGNDSSGQTGVESYDGTSWTHATSLPYNHDGNIANSEGPNRVSCASASFCMARSGANYATFDGSNWSTGTAPGTGPLSLAGLSCVSATFCMGTDIQGRAATFDGAGWSAPVSVTGSVRQWSVSCVSASACVAVGLYQAVTFDGTSWSAESTIDPGHSLTAVSCISSTNCRASDSAGSVVSFDGNDWSAPVPVEPNGGAASISCSTAGTCGLVDNSAKETATMFDGTSWGTPKTVDHLTGNLTGVSCTSASFCLAVDSGGNALSYDGTSWSPPTYIDDGSGLTGVSCSATTFCAAVDAAGRALTFDGSNWSAPVPVLSGRLAAVSCASSSFCATVGADKAATYNGSNWTAATSIVPGPDLSGVSCRSATFCVAVLSSGLATRFDGTGWLPLEVATGSGGTHDISCPSTSYCLALGGVGSSWNGSAWSPYFQPATQLIAASCPQAQFCVTAAVSFYRVSQAQAVVWDGSEWSMPAVTSARILPGSTISCPTTTFCMQLDGATSAYRLDG